MAPAEAVDLGAAIIDSGIFTGLTEKFAVLNINVLEISPNVPALSFSIAALECNVHVNFCCPETDAFQGTQFSRIAAKTDSDFSN